MSVNAIGAAQTHRCSWPRRFSPARFLDYSDRLTCDAVLAALVEFWLRDAGLVAPPWTESTSRTLVDPQFPQLAIYDLEPDLANVPPEFLRCNVLIKRSTLQSL